MNAREWQLPQLSMRFASVWRRNFLVWRKYMFERLLSNVVEPLITLVAFGYGLGGLLPQIEGVSYLEFLASGSICMSVMYSAKFESLWGAFGRMDTQKTWTGIMNTPTTIDDILAGELAWAATKSTITAAAILAVIWALGITHSPLSLLAVPVAFFVAMAFSAMALIVTAVAKGYDTLQNYFVVVITPMVFVSGVFFPMSQLPEWLRVIADWLPLSAAVAIMRPLVLGHWPAHLLQNSLLLAIYLLVCYMVALALTRRRLLT
jgi:lipooligosaccharide transport system permease protein